MKVNGQEVTLSTTEDGELITQPAISSDTEGNEELANVKKDPGADKLEELQAGLRAATKERNEWKTKAKELADAQKTQAANGDDTKTNELLNEWKTKAEEATKELNRVKNSYKIKDIATSIGFNDPSDAVDALSSLTLEEDEIETKVKELAERKPHWLKAEDTEERLARGLGSQFTQTSTKASGKDDHSQYDNLAKDLGMEASELSGVAEKMREALAQRNQRR